jgi:hypothetical protein
MSPNFIYGTAGVDIVDHTMRLEPQGTHRNGGIEPLFFFEIN